MSQQRGNRRRPERGSANGNTRTRAARGQWCCRARSWPLSVKVCVGDEEYEVVISDMFVLG
jgi:hypothetical protein